MVHTKVSQRMHHRLAAPSAAPKGKVNNQAPAILPITFQSPCPVTVPIPNNAPQLTCVVDTGIPSRLAAMTISPVIKLATNPWP